MFYFDFKRVHATLHLAVSVGRPSASMNVCLSVCLSVRPSVSPSLRPPLVYHQGLKLGPPDQIQRSRPQIRPTGFKSAFASLKYALQTANLPSRLLSALWTSDQPGFQSTLQPPNPSSITKI